MGLILKQSIRGNFYTALGAILGLITAGYLNPVIFTPAQVGVQNLLFSYSQMFGLIGSLGFMSVITRKFTYFRNSGNSKGFFFFSILVLCAGILLQLIVFAIFKNDIINWNLQKSALFTQYIYYLVPLSVFASVFFVYDVYYTFLYNSVIGTFIKEFLVKIFNLLIILLFFYAVFNFDNYILFYVIVISLPGVLIFLSLLKEKNISLKPDFSIFKDIASLKQIGNISLFGFIAALSGLITQHIDKILVGSYISLADAGIYSVNFLYASFVLIPSRSIVKSSSVIISDSWKNNDLKLIHSIYYKSCLNQYLIGLFLFLGLWLNADNLYQIIPHEYSSGKIVLLLIGLTSLVEMATGANALIIQTSVKYRYYTYFTIIYGVSSILLSWWFIQLWGVTGVAVAALVSRIIFNAAEYFYILKQFKMQPYNGKFITVTFIGLLAFIPAFFIPSDFHFIIDILIRSTVFVIVFGLLTIVSKVSEEVDMLYAKYINKITKKIKNK